MSEEGFIENVRQEAPLDSEDAARDATAATLATLGERVTDGAASDLAQQLPEPVGGHLTDAPGEAEPFSLDEFTTRMSDRADINDSRVTASARAVVTVVSMEAPARLETAREQLPAEFDVIFEPSGPITTDEFLDTVRTRASVDSEAVAWDATAATLATLGERLSQGEATDLALYLPDAFEETIVESGDESAMEYSREEFVQRVAQRESVEIETATTHARAVCSALAETASERELGAAKKQLPDPFGVLFEPSDGEKGDSDG